MPQPIVLPFPHKGVNRNAARSSQPAPMPPGSMPDTTWNALNVVPYDRFGRPRGGQRPGTTRLQASALANAAVMALEQVATIIPPGANGATNLILEDKFTYTNGTQLNNTGNWKAYPNRNSFGTPNTWAAITNPPGSVTSLVTGLGGTYALYQNAVNLGTQYKIKVAFTFSNAVANQTYAIVFRQNVASPTNSDFQLQITTTNFGVSGSNSITLTPNGGGSASTALTGQTLNDNQVYQLELRVTGDNLEGWLDGVQKVTLTSSAVNTNFGFGFFVTNGTLLALPHAVVADYRVYTASAASLRQNNLVAVCSGNVYEGDQTGLSLVTSGSGIVSTSPGIQPAIAFTQAFGYIVDGTSILKLDVVNKAMNAYAATAGTAPTGCTIATVYRDRLILAAPQATPQNFFCSRVGVPTDWDYSQTDPAAAFAGNASTAGHIGEPITALMPFNDDVMLIGGDHNMWAVRGDPADGGSIDLISDAIGVFSQNAWAKDPSGIIYFVGPSGLYKIAPNGMPESLSSTSYNQFFAGLDRKQNYITLEWDKDNFGLYVFVTPINGGTTTHLYWDARNGGFWPLQFPVTHGPFSAVVFDGDTLRQLILGGQTGLLQLVSPTALDDDGTAISSLLSLGPFQPAPPSGDAVVTGLDVTLGENFGTDQPTVINVTWTLKGGKSAFEVTEDTPRRIVAGTFTFKGRQLTRRPRLRGGWFALEFSNNVIDTYWSLEQVTVHVEQQGKQR